MKVLIRTKCMFGFASTAPNSRLAIVLPTEPNQASIRCGKVVVVLSECATKGALNRKGIDILSKKKRKGIDIEKLVEFYKHEINALVGVRG